MNESLITVRYAKALYDLASESKQLDVVVKDIENIKLILDESEEFKQFIMNPILKISEKLRIIDVLFAGKLQKMSIQFLYLLINNTREMYLKDICIYFLSYYKKNKGIYDALITTAIPLTETHRKEIYAVIHKKFKVNIDLKEKVDPSIIGGFILRIDDQQINASLSAQLNKIKRELIHS
ncbi:MAG: ATP synthase F1 subunit delta [Bacteroidales bacterium]|nr:ATP synthase F1 subunit delta [Bacteroidales bacterium]